MNWKKNGSSEGLENDNNIKATIAHFKGNCYAMRGDNNRAKAEYGIANKYGNPELKQAAKHNKETADHINERMQENPELRKRLNRNVSEHSKFEEELEAFLNQLGRDLNKIKLGKIFSKRN